MEVVKIQLYTPGDAMIIIFILILFDLEDHLLEELRNFSSDPSPCVTIEDFEDVGLVSRNMFVAMSTVSRRCPLSPRVAFATGREFRSQGYFVLQ